MSLLRALRAYVGLGPDEDYEDRYLQELDRDLDDRRAANRLEIDLDLDEEAERAAGTHRGGGGGILVIDEPTGGAPGDGRGDDRGEGDPEIGGVGRRPAGRPARTGPDLRPVPRAVGGDERDDDDEFIERLLAGEDPEVADGPEIDLRDGPTGAGRPDEAGGAHGGEVDDVLAPGVLTRSRSTNHAGRSPRPSPGASTGPSTEGDAVVHSLDSRRAKPRTIAPESFADAKLVADEFRRDIPVLLNLQALDRELARRLIDFASGICYVLDGSMEKVASQAFLLIPESVEVSDDDRRRIEERGYAR